MKASQPTFKVGLNPEEKALYTQLFKSLDPENTGVITGENARSTFEKSGLPPAILGEIWQIADQNNLGFLNQFGFCYAMRLIGYTQAGNHPKPGLADVPGPLPKFADLPIPRTPSATIQPQSTNSSFLSTQPSNAVPQSAAPQESFSAVSPQDFNKFSQLFVKTVGSINGELNGNQAKDIFLKARLQTSVLGQIWNLVDRNNTGSLNVGAFVIAMHLIQGLLSGRVRELPPFLPESIWSSVEGNKQKSQQQLQQQSQPPQQPPQQYPQVHRSNSSRQPSGASVHSQSTAIRHPPSRVSSSNPQVGEWVATPTMKAQYDSIFTNLDKENTGQLNPDQVASFLMTSKLDQQDLALIWDLADIQNTGIFTKLEFGIALFLVNRKVSGKSLPNVIPNSLISSLSAPSPTTSSSNPPPSQNSASGSTLAAPPLQQHNSKPKSSIDDLADIFSSPSPSIPSTAQQLQQPQQPQQSPQHQYQQQQPPPQPQPQGHHLQQRISSSDLSKSELPKVRSTLTGSFKPTSTFGQTLMQNLPSPSEVPESKAYDNLLGEDVKPAHQSSAQGSPQKSPVPVLAQAQAQPQQQQQQQQQQKTVNYDALRNVPPPPKKGSQTGAREISRESQTSSPQLQQQPQQPQQPQQWQQSSNNNDLLADPAHSAQLSQASSDLANVSNQINSLHTQTTNLHDKKLKADQELQKILSAKKEFESKLKTLKASYENEVAQVKSVEESLVTAREESEALRSEASIAEAKLNSLSSELNEKQVAVESLQKENNSLKEKLGALNAESGELEKQLAQVRSQAQGIQNQVAVKKSQVQVVIVKNQDLKSEIAEIEESHKKLQQEIDNAETERLHQLKKQQELEAKKKELDANKPSKPSAGLENTGLIAGAGAAVGAAIGGVASAVSHTLSDSTMSGDDENTVTNTSTNTNTNTNRSSASNSSGDRQTRTPSNLSKEVKQLSLDEGGASTDNATNATSSVATDRAIETDTPITSPTGSEYQYPHGANAGIAGISGGMVGMPGVLVGVQRTDSLTSSVQNNAALSVRDDNIDVSDRETIDQVQEETRDSDKGSSSFEMVNSADARSPEEFPPIRELDYQESDSSDEEGERPEPGNNYRENGDGTSTNGIGSAGNSGGSGGTNAGNSGGNGGTDQPYESETLNDDEFADLEPAAVDDNNLNEEEFFDDEFDNLEDAQFDNAGDDEFYKDDVKFNNEFTNSNAPNFGGSIGAGGVGNDGSAPISGSADNDEWEQLFAGFGNSQPSATEETEKELSNVAGTQSPQSQSEQLESSTTIPGDFPASPDFDPKTNFAVQELVGMGFEETTAIEALKDHNGDLEAATNYLLDNA
ncbi:hypothetical protein PVL30_002980 [Lodderomyces elongisporus]|uniref:uncharacterized protein n=1 Tax=Lodderomyces elongisporus TaxID=36914 RepID=UPI0029230F61|nr:uncharacterized protein PVL30_002980 [Lodderomyces elongisporus]WLF79228.1 hypothetical protein PVL30_002980 [Lodderomyces elongisporus]